MKVVLLPGLDGTGKLFKPFIDALPKDLDVLVISYPTDQSLAYTDLIDLVLAKLPQEDYLLIGESFSGYIAYQIALRETTYLKEVIFVASFLEAPHPYLLGFSKLLPRKTLFSFRVPDVVARFFLFGQAVDNEVMTLFQQAMAEVSPQVLAFRLNAIAELPQADQSCQTPAIYIQASKDKLVPRKSVKVFKELFSSLEVRIVEGSHFILQANPQACANIVVGSIAS